MNTAAMDCEQDTSDVTDVTGDTRNGCAVMRVTSKFNGGVTAVTPKAVDIPAEDRPCFRVFDAPTRIMQSPHLLRAGVWHFSMTKPRRNEKPQPVQSWICAPIHVVAITHNTEDNDYGRLLHFLNTSNRWRTWSMPMELWGGKADAARAELLAMGLDMDIGQPRMLPKYLFDQRPDRTIRCVTQVGWSGKNFVLPDEVFGPDKANVTFQSGSRGHAEYTQAGTVEEWRNRVAALAVGNPFLALGLSVAFSGPLLDLCSAESGGIHLVGASSTGKTTIVDAASSVWGGSSYKRSWRATANGLEGAAVMFNDGLLALDEISECNPLEVGNIVYALGNGSGKQRAGRSGLARPVMQWRCAIISSGERTVATSMEAAGQQQKAGQAVRLLDIPVTAAYGAFDTLHHYESGSALSDSIKKAVRTNHGAVGRQFLQLLANDERNHAADLEALRNRSGFINAEDHGQVRRAAARFTLVAYAGQLATEYGLTGWPEGLAFDAAASAFALWKSARGDGDGELQAIKTCLSEFIQLHGDSRFSERNDKGARIIKRAGWWEWNDSDRVYLFTSAGLHEALNGFDFKPALNQLQSAGILDAPASGEKSKTIRAGGRHERVYRILPNRLGV